MIMKIVSDGKGTGTRIELEDGTILDNAYEVNWSCKVGEIAHMDVKFRDIPAMVQGTIPEDEFNKNYEIVEVTRFGDNAVKRAIVKRRDNSE